MKARENWTSRRIGYSVAVLLVLVSPWVQGVSKVWAATGLSGSGSFGEAFGIAVDGSGNVYVTNQDTSTSPPYVEELSGGTWSDLSSGGLFSTPGGVAVDGSGNIFITNQGSTSTYAVEERSSGSWSDLSSGGTFFSTPRGIAVDASGNVFITNQGNTTTYAVAELSGGSWSDITDGYSSFNQPSGITVDSAGDLFVTNAGNNTIVERAHGSTTWTDITGSGTFNQPTGIAVDGSGNVFVTNKGNTTTNAVEELTGGTWHDVTGSNSFVNPSGIAVDSADHLFVTNWFSSMGGFGGPATSAVVEYTPLLAPTGLSASSTTSTGTTLTWNAVSGATSYDVYEGGTQIASGVTTPSYAVTGLTPGTSYSFTVSAVNSDGEYSQSGPATVNTPVVAPTAPTRLSASGTTSTGSTLTWNAVSGATSYNVYKNGTQIATGVTSASYAVTGLTAGTSYSFTVTAVNSGGESAQSNAATVNPVNSGSITLTFASTTVQSGASQTVTGVVYENNAPFSNAVVNLSSTIGAWSGTGTSSETVTADVYGAFSTTWTAPTVTATTSGTATATVSGSVYGVTPTTVSITVTAPPAPPVSAPSLSKNTQIQDKPSDSQKYVWSVNNTSGSQLVSVVNGTTVAQFTGAIQSTDGSTQTYAVHRAGYMVGGSATLKDGDVLVVTAADGQTTAKYTISTWMEVSTAAQLEQIDKNQGNYLNANIRLMNNIDLAGYSGWIPLGDFRRPSYEMFSGTFDGQGHEITGLTINDTTDEGVGFFGITTGTIENVGINATVKGGIGVSATGGLVGAQQGGSISDCYATGSVSGENFIGGLVGAQMGGSITNSYATGSVSGGDSSSIGGLVGYQPEGTISGSYATGLVVGGRNSHIGVLVGYVDGGIVTDSYFDTNTINQSRGIGAGPSQGATGLSDSDMKTQSKFQGWDFTKIWGVSASVNGGYPYLRAVAPQASTASNNTQIQDKQSDNQTYVWSVNNGSGSLSVSVVNGSTVAQLTGAIQSTDGSTQTYAVQRQGQPVGGSTSLKDGDALVVTAADGQTTANYTISTWMEVSTAAQLEQIDQNQDEYQNANIRLMKNIDLTGYSGWIPIGGHKIIASSGTYAPFSGTFDGQGHTIMGLTIDTSSLYAGFFGMTSGTIENVGIDATVKAYVGYTGGLVGYQLGGSIRETYATGSVSGGSGPTGGLVGIEEGSISDSYATGSVTGSGYTGGLVGTQDSGAISDSYATGSVTGSGDTGGLVGFLSEGTTISNSYFDKDTTAQSTGVGLGDSTGVTGVSDSDMKTQSTFQGWDFTHTWGIKAGVNNGYPYLLAVPPSMSNNTQVQDKQSDSQTYVWSVDNAKGSASVSVVNGTTVAQLTGAIQSTDGSTQTYAVQRAGQTISGSTTLKDGDVLVVTAADGQTTANYTVSTWMEVSTAAQLEQIDQKQGNYLKANIKLMNNIDLTGYSGWGPIGGNKSYAAFSGTFDGQGHEVTGLTIDRSNVLYKGFFGVVRGTIENVGIDATVKGSTYTGGLVGEQIGGSISGSYVTGSVKGSTYTGGLVGEQTGGSISGSYATGSVSGFTFTGGLVGFSGGSISGSYATASVSGGTYTGGLVGQQEGSISGSYATGPVTGGTYTGGLVGDQKKGTISDSYATGSVKGTTGTGGLVGTQQGSISRISGSHATGQVSGGSSTGGLVGTQIKGDISHSYATGSVHSGTPNHGGSNTGGLVGAQSGGSISGSHATGSVSGGTFTGGLVGDQPSGTSGIIRDSYATGSVKGTDGTGGLVGLQRGNISGSHATGRVSGRTSTGGLVGTQASGTISASYATGSVKNDTSRHGGNYTGGLVGKKVGGTIHDSYATGAVTGGPSTGGLVGNQYSGGISGSYFDKDTTGQRKGVGTGSKTGVTGETDALMKSRSTFQDWDFNNTWAISPSVNGGYPYLL